MEGVALGPALQEGREDRPPMQAFLGGRSESGDLFRDLAVGCRVTGKGTGAAAPDRRTALPFRRPPGNLGRACRSGFSGHHRPVWPWPRIHHPPDDHPLHARMPSRHARPLRRTCHRGAADHTAAVATPGPRRPWWLGCVCGLVGLAAQAQDAPGAAPAAPPAAAPPPRPSGWRSPAAASQTRTSAGSPPRPRSSSAATTDRAVWRQLARRVAQAPSGRHHRRPGRPRRGTAHAWPGQRLHPDPVGR